VDRPADLFDREVEWADLDAFAAGRRDGLEIGVVLGRRRQGKSFLLRRLVAAHGGVYGLALEEERKPALRRFGRAVATALDLPAELDLDDWTRALRLALGLEGPGPGRLVVIDEFPYLLRGAPELPSAIQAIYDDAREAPSGRSAKLILCGSAFSIMSELLSGAHPLRGRARLNVLIRPFDFRTARSFWGVDDLDVAVRMNAIVGGTPGYRDLTDDTPQSQDELDAWLAQYLLNPSHALFAETDHLLREDPRIVDRALYQSVLAAVAAGETTPGAIANVLGRDARSLWHPLDVLRTAGFVRRSEDVLTRRKPIYTIADPIIRFGMLVVRPRQAQFEERRAAQAWAEAADVVSSRILGPHVEEMAREWTLRHASPATLGGPVSIVGSAVLNDPAGRARHEIDVVALPQGETLHRPGAQIQAIGEAKSTNRPRGPGDLSRLDGIRDLLAVRGQDVTSTRLLVFSRSGFTEDLAAAAGSRPDVELVDLDRLYRGT
jgi:AAA+ ATPase superfamily predicted ATPase